MATFGKQRIYCLPNQQAPWEVHVLSQCSDLKSESTDKKNHPTYAKYFEFDMLLKSG